MRNIKKLSFPNVLVGNLILAITFWVPLAQAQNPHTDGIIAIVNDDAITLKDLRQYVASIASQLRIESKSPEEIQQIMRDYEQKGLEKLVQDKLILEAANDKGIEVRDDIIDKRIKEIRGRYASDEELNKALNNEGMTVGDLRRKLTDQMKVKFEVDMEVRDKVFVNPQDVTEYYEKHKLDFNRKPKVNLQSVFVSFAKYNKQVAYTRADEARSRMLAGEDFDKISQQYSDGSSVGEIEQGQMADNVENVVFNLKLDEVSDPVEVGNGIYVFKAIGISPGKLQTLPEVKDLIYGKLLDAQFQSKFTDWIDKLRQKAYVEIKP